MKEGIDRIKALCLLLIALYLEDRDGAFSPRSLARASGLTDRQIRSYISHWRELGLVSGNYGIYRLTPTALKLLRELGKKAQERSERLLKERGS
ncbi:MAG: hypothetical protein DRJ41_04405 [Thermoprotei archaeon]|nr:MAG: hypothetical protein DRJ41_04405 [Thermoprotei archaeon]